MLLKDFLSGLIQSIVKLLPVSPFKPYIASIQGWQGLGWLNWFMPVSAILGVCAAWLTAIAAYYLFSAIARWLKLIV